MAKLLPTPDYEIFVVEGNVHFHMPHSLALLIFKSGKCALHHDAPVDKVAFIVYLRTTYPHQGGGLLTLKDAKDIVDHYLDFVKYPNSAPSFLR